MRLIEALMPSSSSLDADHRLLEDEKRWGAQSAFMPVRTPPRVGIFASSGLSKTGTPKQRVNKLALCMLYHGHPHPPELEMNLRKVCTSVSAACMLSLGTSSALATLVDFTGGTGGSASIGGAIFENPANLTNVGTGVVDPFLSIGANGNATTKSGFNTDANPLPLDAKRPQNFTGPITVGQIGTVDRGGVFYKQFFLDINETNSADDRYLSLDTLQIALGNVGNLSAMPGPLIYDMDALEPSEVLLNYDLFAGSGLGFDLTFFVPAALFGSDSDKFVYLFAAFGNRGVVGARNYGQSDGFEEFWASRATPVRCPPGSTLPECFEPPNEIPEPGSLAVLSLGLIGLGLTRRRRPR